jgi:hypothetical protein
VPAAKSREPFRKFLGPLLVEKRTVSSLKPVANNRLQNEKPTYAKRPQT